MNNLVKITKNNNGEVVENPKWCLVDPCNIQGRATLCDSEFFGLGESACEYEEKTGKITCPKCIAIIKIYKKIKL